MTKFDELFEVVVSAQEDAEKSAKAILQPEQGFVRRCKK